MGRIQANALNEVVSECSRRHTDNWRVRSTELPVTSKLKVTPILLFSKALNARQNSCPCKLSPSTAVVDGVSDPVLCVLCALFKPITVT